MSLVLFQHKGIGGNVAALPAFEVDTFKREVLVGSECYAGVKFDADGVIYSMQSNGGWSSVGSWLLSGVNTAFWVTSVIDSGALGTDAGRGPLAMSTDREFSVLEEVYGQTDDAQVSFEISTDVSGTPIVATGTYVIQASLGGV
jgi:hypothetical protein